ncbi:oxidoreductase C-terminal domain-containing protein [Pseudomonas syringae]|uniref:oxidoreductase C-terminal domain-containing protein n=1 Tax=Pseudomonas syringae TaxID=317 RepID=UPI0039C8E877
MVDSACATSAPNIYAAGEVTNYPIQRLSVRTRSESWTAASEQGSVAGRAAAGDKSASYNDMPWLWSDQYDSSIQCIGLTKQATKCAIIGELDSSQWLALGWNAENQLLYAIAANRGRDISAIRRVMKRNDALPELYTSALASATSRPPN